MKMQKHWKRLMTGAAAAGISAAVLPCSVSAYELELHSQEEIRAFYAAHPFPVKDEKKPEYAQEQLLSAPYTPGVLGGESLQEALNAVNTARYIAGLPADITIRGDYSELAQAAALIDWYRSELDHELGPDDKPADFSDELFALCKTGTKYCNLHYGYYTLPAAIYEKDLCDSDMGRGVKNMQTAGHRRWLLNPKMQYIGFGQITGSGRRDLYSAVYALDHSREEAFTGDYIAWPPQNMPYELYSLERKYQSNRYPFSVSLNQQYAEPSAETVQVDLYSHQLDRSWHFDRNDCLTDDSSMTAQEKQEAYSHYFNVNISNRSSIRNCIIFCPDVFFAPGDTVDVRISGIQTAAGEDTEITYSVSFFSLEETQVQPAQVLRGDADCNGEVNVLDAVLLSRVEAEDLTCGITDEGRLNSDCDGDGRVTFSDLTWLLKKLAATS